MLTNEPQKQRHEEGHDGFGFGLDLVAGEDHPVAPDQPARLVNHLRGQVLSDQGQHASRAISYPCFRRQYV